MPGIYKIVNTKNGKFYLGSSARLPERWEQHRSWLESKNRDHHSVALQRAWDKYGGDIFEFKVVERCSEPYLKDLEQEYLNREECHYNISRQASGGDLISYHPNRNDIIEKMSEASRKKWKDPEYRSSMPSRRGIENPNWKGGLVDEKTTCECGNDKAWGSKSCSECRDRTGEKNPFYGKEHSEKTKQIIARKKSGKYYGDQEKAVEIDGEVYCSLSKAARNHAITLGVVHNRLNSDNFPEWDYI